MNTSCHISISAGIKGHRKDSEERGKAAVHLISLGYLLFLFSIVPIAA